MSLTLKTRQVGEVTVVDLAGEILLGEGSSALRETLRGLAAKPRNKILLNLGNVTYIDSTGLGELVGGFVSVTNHGGQLKLLNCAQTFEVATVKLLSPGRALPAQFGIRGGPGTKDPARFTCMACLVPILLYEANPEMQFYQLGPQPDWMKSTRYDITAKVPEGATPQPYHAMLRNLLAERFQMETHWESKEMAAYELVIAKGGPRLKDSIGPFVESAEEPTGPFRRDEDGFVITGRPHPVFMSQVAGGLQKFAAQYESMDELAKRLASLLAKPVFNETGLTGRYDYTLTFSRIHMPQHSPPDGVAGTPLEGVIQSQLGLKLVPRQRSVQILVIDHAEKIPNAN
jgi:anti-sigma B factor antagonist